MQIDKSQNISFLSFILAVISFYRPNKSIQSAFLAEGSLLYSLENFILPLTPIWAFTTRFIYPIYLSISSNFFAFIS